MTQLLGALLLFHRTQVQFPALFLVNFKRDGIDSITLFCGLAKDREVSSSVHRAKIRLTLNVARRPDSRMQTVGRK